MPIRRGRRYVEASSALMLSLVKGSRNLASSDAIRMSHDRVIVQPPPTAAPLIEGISGFSISRATKMLSARPGAVELLGSDSGCSGVRSAPEQNPPPPRPP